MSSDLETTPSIHQLYDSMWHAHIEQTKDNAFRKYAKVATWIDHINFPRGLSLDTSLLLGRKYNASDDRGLNIYKLYYNNSNYNLQR